MSLAQLKTKANAKLTEFWDLLLPKQESYFLKHGKFFQLVVTDPVVDGVDTTWVLNTPFDEQHPLDVNFTFNSPVPFSISVDEWRGDTTGFSATAIIELPNGDRYFRSRSAIPVVQKATYDTSDPDNPVILIPQSVASWNITTSPWEQIIPEVI